jgi:hypothetical protein
MRAPGVDQLLAIKRLQVFRQGRCERIPGGRGQPILDPPRTPGTAGKIRSSGVNVLRNRRLLLSHCDFRVVQDQVAIKEPEWNVSVRGGGHTLLAFTKARRTVCRSYEASSREYEDAVLESRRK